MKTGTKPQIISQPMHDPEQRDSGSEVSLFQRLQEVTATSAYDADVHDT
jgi:hypothetical protein